MHRSRLLHNTRRQFLSSCPTTMGAMALSSLLGESTSAAPVNGPAKPAAVKNTPFPARAKRIIYLHMAGGPSQLDLYDYKPRLSALNGQLCPDEFYKEQRLGQKNGKGFYNYGVDKRGKPSKTPAEEAYALMAPHVAEKTDFEADDIIARLMIPMANEAIRCLEEGIVDSAAEADMALLYGLGFPPFRGGIFRWIETIGLANFVAMADKYAELGPIYQISDGVREMAASGKSYFA